MQARAGSERSPARGAGNVEVDSEPFFLVRRQTYPQGPKYGMCNIRRAPNLGLAEF